MRRIAQVLPPLATFAPLVLWRPRPQGRVWGGVQRCLGGIAILVVVMLPRTAYGIEPSAVTCISDTIGLDASRADNSAGAVMGDCPGESFYASDTLMEFLRVWRAASETDDVIGMHLYIMGTGPEGAPYQGSIIVDGPTIVHEYGDGVHPIEFKWTWDPPLVLPHAGLYAFMITEDPCLGIWDILSTDDPTLYTAGDMYFTKAGCVLGPNYSVSIMHYPQYDVVFQAGFCRDAVTPTIRKSWGKLKLHYR